MSDEIAKVIQLFQEDPQAARKQEMHIGWEAMFLHYGQTLTDPVAAESLRAAIAMMDLLLDGSCATDLISEDQRNQLRGIMHIGLSAADEFQS
ncbi:hypothetical protein [Streptomyces sp. NPDC059970]|uniref:hypothetical protein n=1 Tax=Streptomyces sp. NPDC059970 TaxID=3347019 RepID=UPI0036BFDE0A